MIVGIVDARLNSVNTRFLIFTKIFSELRRLLLLYNADISVMHKYCGIGDLGLTSLNDLSRNRTLGLMIGKGFLGKGKVHSALIEGLRTLDIVYRFLIEKKVVMDFPLIASLWKLIRFSSSYSVNSFIQDILGK
jgi:glycerol-3-phosphate dehydrogenase (NAD(P)+)